MNEEIQETLNVLKSGGIILYPTDTVWGIGCDATNEQAIKKIFSIKQRHEKKGLILLLDNDNKLNRYIKEVPEVAWDIIEHSTRPTTIIYPGATNLPKNIIAEDGTIAIRITTNEFCKKLINKLGRPLVSTSANISGSPTPESFNEIDDAILKDVDYVVNLSQKESTKNKPSVIIKLELNGEFKFVRK